MKRTPLVFLPGAGGSASFWCPVADRLADLGRAQVLGYPGFDGVPCDPRIKSLDDLFGWLVEQLPPGPSHVIAQSMGGILAARLAIECPERVARLVLVATSGGVDVAGLGAAGWRVEYRTALPDVPTWFVDDRTDLTGRLAAIRALSGGSTHRVARSWEASFRPRGPRARRESLPCHRRRPEQPLAVRAACVRSPTATPALA